MSSDASTPHTTDHTRRTQVGRPAQLLRDPSLYLNRELSWLDFNERVLQLAEDERVPLLERVKFCAIYTTNLDEFYMVRVAGLRDQIDAGVRTPSQDGRTPSETIALIRERVLGLGRRLTDCFEGQLRPALAEHDIHVVGVRELDDERARGAGHSTSRRPSSRRSPRWRSPRAGRSPTSPTCRSAWRCWSATRSPTRPCSRA